MISNKHGLRPRDQKTQKTDDAMSSNNTVTSIKTFAIITTMPFWISLMPHAVFSKHTVKNPTIWCKMIKLNAN